MDKRASFLRLGAAHAGLVDDPMWNWTVISHALFPDSRIDALYFSLIWSLEAERTGHHMIPNGQSRVFDAITHIMKKRYSQGAITGLISLSYIYLHDRGVRPSLERAAHLASELVYEVEHVYCKDEKFRMAGDRASIKSIFRKYRPYAHVWAGVLLHKLIREDSDVIEQNRDFATLYSNLGKRLQEVAATSSWNMLRFPVPEERCRDRWRLTSGLETAFGDAFARCREGGAF